MSDSSAHPPGPADPSRPEEEPAAPTPLESTFIAPPSGLAPTVTVGPYRLVEKIGVGGMGEVYLADQTFPVRRHVALKLIKLGMDTKEVVARFESERQALALLNHPNIAHVFDAGISAEGRPYFAMEFVQGVSILEYCNTERLAIPERLKLFIQACEGVQHAHQKGIIHRDLKPSNILVAMLDGKPVPKIIDFGIAKAISQRLTESTLHTEVGHMIGTPAYMSPEQADRTLLDIDTRADVYSLGAVLYELLTGELPLGRAAPRSQGYEDIVRSIREVEPVRPSTRITTGAAAAAVAAKAFRSDAPSLARDLRGDLDWIVLRALEKDRTRRYASVSELAADIERHLRHEPVLASPPSTPYRVRKFVRRHRMGVTAGVAVGLAFVAGIVGTSVGLVRAQEAERKAREEAETATEVTDFMVDLFHVSDPSEARGNTITAREVLDKGANTIQQRLADKPVVRTRLMDAMGKVYANLGLHEPAVPLLRKVLAVRERTFGPDSPEAAASLMNLADAVGGREKYRGEEVPLTRRALAIRQKVFGLHDSLTAASLYALSTRLPLLTAEHTQCLESALSIFRELRGSGDQGAAWCLNDLGLIRQERGDPEGAVPLFREALRLKEASVGPEATDFAMGLNNLGFSLMLSGNYAEAEPLLRRGVEVCEKSLGPEHPANGVYLHSLGELLRRTGRTGQAREVLEHALRVSEQQEGVADDYQGSLVHYSLAALYADLRLDAKAEFHFRRVIDRINFGYNTLDLPDWLEKYAELLDRKGRTIEASAIRARAREVRASLPSPKPSPVR